MSFRSIDEDKVDVGLRIADVTAFVAQNCAYGKETAKKEMHGILIT